MIKVGIIGEVKDKVSENNIAKALRSGELNVYATPAMVALMEEAAYKSIKSELEEGARQCRYFYKYKAHIKYTNRYGSYSKN